MKPFDVVKCSRCSKKMLTMFSFAQAPNGDINYFGSGLMGDTLLCSHCASIEQSPEFLEELRKDWDVLMSEYWKHLVSMR